MLFQGKKNNIIGDVEPECEFLHDSLVYLSIVAVPII